MIIVFGKIWWKTYTGLVLVFMGVSEGYGITICIGIVLISCVIEDFYKEVRKK
jgi:hypothetical protein